MGDHSKIEWTEASWNPVTGCTKVSVGCDLCYAETIAERFRGGPAYPNGFDVTLREHKLDQPLRWTQPRRIFVNSMSDLFHDDVPDEYIARVFAIMARAPQHTFQVLTKRHGRMRALLSSSDFREQVFANLGVAKHQASGHLDHFRHWPLPNVWLGVSTEDQRWADIRIPALLNTPAAIRFISAEPLLGHINIGRWLTAQVRACGRAGAADKPFLAGLARAAVRQVAAEHGEREPAFLDWVIAGGESGPKARPMHPEWARSLRDQCAGSGVAFLFKQWGEWVPESLNLHTARSRAAFLSADGTMRPLVDGKPAAAPMSRGAAITIRRAGKKAAGRELDGRTWDQFPDVTTDRACS